MVKRIVLLVSTVFVTSFAHAERIEVTVAGMVCSFCAQGIERTLKRELEATDIRIDLDNHRVDFSLKHGTPVSDERVQELIRDAGYDVKGIKRTAGE